MTINVALHMYHYYYKLTKDKKCLADKQRYSLWDIYDFSFISSTQSHGWTVALYYLFTWHTKLNFIMNVITDSEIKFLIDNLNIYMYIYTI